MKEKKEENMYVIKIPLMNEPWISKCLDTIFETAHDLYNEGIAEIRKRLLELEEIEEYKSALKQIAILKKEEEGIKKKDKKRRKEIEKELKVCYAVLNNLREQKGIKASYQEIQTKIIVHIKQSKSKYSIICSPFYSSISKDIARSLEKYYYGNGKILHFKSRKNNNQSLSNLRGSRICTDKSNIFKGIILDIDNETNLLYIKVTGVYKEVEGKKKEIKIPLDLKMNETTHFEYVMKNLFYACEMNNVPKTKKECLMFL